MMIVGGVVGLAGVGGGLAVFLGGGSKTEAKAEAAEASEGKEGKKEEGKKEEKKEEGKKEEKKEEGKKEEKKEEGKKDEKKEGKEGEGKEGEGKKEEKKEEKKDPKTSKLEGVDFGCTLPIQPFHLNLGNPLENHYIRLEIAIEYGCNDETKAEVDKRLPQLRDAVIAVTSRKTREFLLGPDGKEQLRKEIFTRINQYMTRKIDDVFITDILIE